MHRSSTAAKKKEIEERFVARLRDNLPGFPSGRLEPTEEPDFLLHTGDRVIGIELTELHRRCLDGAAPQQAREAMRERVVDLAKSLYVSKKQPPVMVTLFLRNPMNIEKRAVKELAETICNVVSRNIPAPNSACAEAYRWVNRDYFPEWLHELRVCRRDEITETFFNCPSSTWVPRLSMADITRVAAPKELRYETYRARCDEVWLVINADLKATSTWFEIDEALVSEGVQTKFQRILLLSYFRSEIYDIPVQS